MKPSLVREGWWRRILAAMAVALTAAFGFSASYTVFNCDPRFDPVWAAVGFIFEIPYIAAPTFIAVMALVLILRVVSPAKIDRILLAKYVAAACLAALDNICPPEHA